MASLYVCINDKDGTTCLLSCFIGEKVTFKDERKRSCTNTNFKIKTHSDSNCLWVLLRPSP